jgi:hypothetical protein
VNARQFVNTVVSATLEKYDGVRGFLNLFPRFLFPEFLKTKRLNLIRRPYQLSIIIYAVVFFLVFVVQAVFAAKNGRLHSGYIDLVSCLQGTNEECLKYFFSDVANLLNYVVLVEAYCIAGVFFLIYASNVDRMLSDDRMAEHMQLSRPPPSLAGGAFSVAFVVFAVTVMFLVYALEVQTYPPHWYMNFELQSTTELLSFFSERTASAPPDAGAEAGLSKLPDNVAWQLRGHFYYLFLNYLLLLFVAFVGVAHFGLFKTAGAIATGLRRVYESCDGDEANIWLNNERINEWLAPFSTQILISKIFVLAIVLNMTSWKMWEKSAAAANDIAIVIMVIVGVWLVTMPRYFVQYHLFRIRKKCGADEYRDIRMTWLLGASALTDLFLLLIAGKILFNAESIFEMLGNALAGG